MHIQINNIHINQFTFSFFPPQFHLDAKQVMIMEETVLVYLGKIRNNVQHFWILGIMKVHNFSQKNIDQK